MTVFVPSAPMMTVGQIFSVAREDVEFLPGASIEAANAVSQWGVGLQPSIALGRQSAAQLTATGQGRSQSAADTPSSPTTP